MCPPRRLSRQYLEIISSVHDTCRSPALNHPFMGSVPVPCLLIQLSKLLTVIEWMFVSSLKSICWKPNPHSDGFRRWEVWVVVRSWAGAPISGTMPLSKWPHMLLCVSHHMRTWWEDISMWTPKSVLQTPNLPAPGSRISHLPNWETSMSATYMPLNLLYFCYNSRNEIKRASSSSMPSVFMG